MNTEDNNGFTVSNTPTPVVLKVVRLGKFKASRMIASQSWALLKKNKDMLWFPVVSAITNLIALTLLLVIYYFLFGFENVFSSNDGESLNSTGYLILFVYYLVSFFIVNFFQAGMLIVAKEQFDGKNTSFKHGMDGAFKNIDKIFGWALVSATVGVVLNFIAERLKIVGRIVSGLLGSAWGILTYFSLPSLIIGQNTIQDSFKESASVIRKTWGETIIVNFGVGLFLGLLMIAGFMVSGIIIFLAPTMVVAILVGVLLIIYILVLMIISTSLSLIFKLALYEYAKNGVMPQAFSPELIEGAIKTGKK